MGIVVLYLDIVDGSLVFYCLVFYCSSQWGFTGTSDKYKSGSIGNNGHHGAAADRDHVIFPVEITSCRCYHNFTLYINSPRAGQT